MVVLFDEQFRRMRDELTNGGRVVADNPGCDLRELRADPAGADARVAVLAAVRQYNGSTAVSLLRLAEHG
jgi:hypothetical protein